ncbi:MAG: AAA family ATPase, partial [archaeon]|nr:AAA family ATPase [archaeon]
QTQLISSLYALRQDNLICQLFENPLYHQNPNCRIIHRHAVARLYGYGVDGVAQPAAPAAPQELRVGSDSSSPVHVKIMKSFPWGSLIGWGATLCLIWWINDNVRNLTKKGGISGVMDNIDGEVTYKDAKASQVTFDDVKGIDETKAEVEQLVDYLRNPEKYLEIGARMPKGVLFTGSPGAGKTLLARALANEAGVDFIYASGSDFDEVFVGLGSRRIRKMFDDARSRGRCIVFIDEIDSLGANRKTRSGFASGREATLNQLLAQLDGFEQSSGILFIGATNFPDVLDTALTRPGRFDRHIQVDLPDKTGRRAILDLYLGKVKSSPDIASDIFARSTYGWSGAELANLVNIAALKAVAMGDTAVKTVHMHAAYDEVLLGVARNTRQIRDEDKLQTATHEAGHAIVAYFTKGANPIRKITIVPRGRAAGFVDQIPGEETEHMTKEELLAKMAICMGGRVSEELAFGKDRVSTGASNDIQQATRIATLMVQKFGMSDVVGPRYIDTEKGDKPSAEADEEISRLLREQYAYAQKVLKKYQPEVTILAQALCDRETVLGTELEDLLGTKGHGKQLPQEVIL